LVLLPSPLPKSQPHKPIVLSASRSLGRWPTVLGHSSPICLLEVWLRRRRHDGVCARHSCGGPMAFVRGTAIMVR
jgi:hypothetical protein